jgi:hypothetical protein
MPLPGDRELNENGLVSDIGNDLWIHEHNFVSRDEPVLPAMRFEWQFLAGSETLWMIQIGFHLAGISTKSVIEDHLFTLRLALRRFPI